VDGAMVGVDSLWPACLLSQIGVLLYYVSFHMLACLLTWSLALGVFLCGESSWLGEKKKGLLLIHKAFLKK
jgi:hypothetical protein